MIRKVFWLLLLFLLACFHSVESQQPKNIPRIGYLSGTSASTNAARIEAFRQGLRELGYVEGQNIEVEYRFAEGKLDRLPHLAAELTRLKVDIILAAGGNSVIRAAGNSTKTIPIVMGGSGIDPVVAGLVGSLARPGGNVTGVTNLTRELGGKRLELLKDAVPNVLRIAVLYEAANLGSIRELKDVLPAAALALGVTVRPWQVQNADLFASVLLR